MVDDNKEELLAKIEKKRKEINNIITGMNIYRQKEVLKLSQQLDELLNRFYQ